MIDFKELDHMQSNQDLEKVIKEVFELFNERKLSPNDSFYVLSVMISKISHFFAMEMNNKRFSINSLNIFIKNFQRQASIYEQLEEKDHVHH